MYRAKGDDSRYISQDVRDSVFILSQGFCFYCDHRIVREHTSGDAATVWEPDHVMNFASGGASTVENLVASCKRCNRQRNAWERSMGGRKTAREFMIECLQKAPRCFAIVDTHRCKNHHKSGSYKYCVHHATGRE